MARPNTAPQSVTWQAKISVGKKAVKGFGTVRLIGTRRLGVIAVLLLVGCGGGGNGSNSGVVTPPSGNSPTSGEYLLEGNGTASLNVSVINSATGALSAATFANVDADDLEDYPGTA